MVDARCMIQDIMMRDTMIHDLVSRSMSTRMSQAQQMVLHVSVLRRAQHTAGSTYTQHTMHTVEQGIADTPYRDACYGDIVDGIADDMSRWRQMMTPGYTSRDDIADGMS